MTDRASERITVLIVDDEPLARENLRIRLRDMPDMEILGECATGAEALRSIEVLAPDVVFLDIRMPDMDGLHVLEQIPPERQPVVVFVTAYDRYSLEAFRLHALDYLLKPFEEQRFDETLATCRRRVRELRDLARLGSMDSSPCEATLAAPDARHPFLSRMAIRARGRTILIPSCAIDWIEACGDYVNIHVGERTWLIRRTMTDLEARMDPGVFARISRSAIVNLERVRELAQAPRGNHFVRLSTGAELKLTRGFRDRFEGCLGDRL